MRSELAAWRMTQLFSASIEGIPPAQRFDYFQRLNRRATIQAVAVPVADFTDKVKDPGDATLKAFFEEHKNQIAMPGSSEPGFKIPRRERFQYFKAEYDIFRELAQVSDEEVRKYYDANKGTMFRKLELPEDKPKAEPQPPGASGETPEPKADAAGESAKPEAASTEPAKETQPASKDANAEPPKVNAAEPAKKPDGVSRSRAVKFRLVADQKAADNEPAVPAKPAAEATAQQASEAKPDTEAEPAAELPAGEAKKLGEGTPEAGKPNAEPQYEPLEKVREQIVNAIKSEKAQQKIQSAIEELSARMRGYSDARDVYLVEKEAKPHAKPPKDLEFVTLAKGQNVAYGETKLASAFEVANSELGKSFASVRGDMPFQFRAAPFTEVAFGSKNPLYSSATTHDADGNVYLSWKVEQEDERVPKFEEVRDDVLSAWKMIEARELARKQAETYAAEAKGQKKPLAEMFAGDKGPTVITAGPFSWMTTGSTPEQGAGSVAMLSEIPGIDNPGVSFMETVFSLSEGESGVAVNQSQNTYYTVEVTEFNPPLKELEDDFARQDFRRYVNVAMTDARQLYRAWVDSISEQADVKWLQEPVQKDRGDTE
jgi:hypothetical protein